MFSEDDIILINRKMTILTFNSLPDDEQKRLLKKWQEENVPVLTVRDVPPLHNDGDQRLVRGRDF